MSSIFTALEWPFGIAAGTAVGGAVAGGITPGVQSIINEANAAHAVKPPAYQLLAAGVSEGKVDPGWAAARAAEQGIGGDAFTRLVAIAEAGPGVSLAFELWRRNLIDDGAFGRAVKREGVEDEWLNPLRALKQRLLSPEELANARQQEFVGDDRLHAEGALQGYDAERMDLLFKMAGLPPGVMDGLTMLRRGIVTEAVYREIVAEGHTKTKYTDDLLALQHHILSGADVAGLWLRGWIDQPTANALGALDGWQPQEMLRLYQNRGRPATVHQVHIGFARGGRHATYGNDEQATALAAVQESDIRREWFDLLWAGRYTYPSAFVIRALTQDGTFSRDVAHQTLLEMGWKPELATLAADAWSGGAAPASAKWLSRAQTRLFTTAHAEFMDGELPDTAAVAALEFLGVPAAEANAVVDLWTYEKGIFRKDLTQAQVLKFYKRGEWTRVQAYDWLTARGLSGDDADALLR